jgi:NADP-dependent 3-hydroxy acid dehydrogenase YdfG
VPIQSKLVSVSPAERQTLTARDESTSAHPLTDAVALVTGASSGIGQAIAVALARRGAAVCAVGRDESRLDQTLQLSGKSARLLPVSADLTADPSIRDLQRTVRDTFGKLDVLIHSAGIIRIDQVADANIQDLDLQYASNVRAPYLLTQTLLPELKKTRGQIVFVNSSLAVRARRADAGQFAAMQRAIRAFAESLREEVNPYGIRVLNVFLGSTATPRQQALHEAEGKRYRPEILLQPEDVATVLVHALSLPATAEITDIHMRPTVKIG